MKVFEIYKKYYICQFCLGRMFSLLGSHTTNLERGRSLLLSLTIESHGTYLSGEKSQVEASINNLKILAENAQFLPARKVLENEGQQISVPNEDLKCNLCNDIFLNLQDYVQKAVNLVEEIEFEKFLVGTRPDPKIINNEDKFKAKFNLLEAEAFKSHFNRDIGKLISTTLQKPAEFSNPEVTLVFNLAFDSVKIETMIKSLFIYGRYNKLIRGIPQTHWDCRKCTGKGCEECNFTGKQYETSVEEMISPEFVSQSEAKSSKFHGAGREDIDVRMLGNGRPFVLELLNPKKRNLDLNEIQELVNSNCKEKIRISGLRFTNKKEVIEIKNNADTVKKLYKVIVKSENQLKIEEFNTILEEIKNIKNIDQRTPERVSHRRADKVREKIIYNIEGKFIDPNHFEFTIESQGGTYIKELINGDNNRTSPSFSEIFGTPLICDQLDVLKIDH